MMMPTKIHAWFLKYGIDPLIGWEVVEIATDLENPIKDEAELFQHMITYIHSMLESVVDDPTQQQLNYLLEHLIPLIRAVAPFLEPKQALDIQYASDCDTPLIESAVRVTLMAGAR